MFCKKEKKVWFFYSFLVIFVPNMKTVLIGAGNIATVLGHALYNAKHDIVQVYSHTMAAANLLAKKLNATATNSFRYHNK